MGKGESFTIFHNSNRPGKPQEPIGPRREKTPLNLHEVSGVSMIGVDNPDAPIRMI
jgi:hypothetical protein